MKAKAQVAPKSKKIKMTAYDSTHDMSVKTKEIQTKFAYQSSSKMKRNLQSIEIPNHILMMVGCRLYSSLCAMYDTWDAVIEYELDAASHSDYAYVHNFIDRTGVKKSVYSGGLDRLEEGSPPDQITDGLNQLHIGLQQSGLNEKLCLMMRCTIVGYVISKSKYAGTAHPLLGVDKFFG